MLIVHQYLVLQGFFNMNLENQNVSNVHVVIIHLYQARLRVKFVHEITSALTVVSCQSCAPVAPFNWKLVKRSVSLVLWAGIALLVMIQSCVPSVLLATFVNPQQSHLPNVCWDFSKKAMGRQSVMRAILGFSLILLELLRVKCVQKAHTKQKSTQANAQNVNQDSPVHPLYWNLWNVRQAIINLLLKQVNVTIVQLGGFRR
jgi:lysylphosphatidylglycerol synthetase-like protein (DUF2156 family)